MISSLSSGLEGEWFDFGEADPVAEVRSALDALDIEGRMRREYDHEIGRLRAECDQKLAAARAEAGVSRTRSTPSARSLARSLHSSESSCSSETTCWTAFAGC